MGKISQYLVDSTPQLSDKVIGTDVSDNNVTKNYLISDILELGSSYFAPINYGYYYDTTTQTTSSGTAKAMQYLETVSQDGVSVDPDGFGNYNQITFTNAGIYNIQFSAQFNRTSGGSDAEVTVWLRLDGVDVPYSATKVTLKANTTYVVAAWNWFQEVTAGQYVEIMWMHNDAIQILHEVASVSHPAIPSVILTVNRVK
jgi:hypothetical protein